MCVAHFFQSNSITPKWIPNLLPNNFLGNDSDIDGRSPIFAGGRRKGTTNRKSGGGNEVMGNFWGLVGPVSDFPSACACCTWRSNSTKSTDKHPLSCHLNWSASSLTASSLLNRRKRRKQPWGDGVGNRTERVRYWLISGFLWPLAQR